METVFYTEGAVRVIQGCFRCFSGCQPRNGVPSTVSARHAANDIAGSAPF